MTTAQAVDLDPRLERISTGHVFTEGPLWSHRENSLYFCDLKGDSVYRWDGTTAGLVRRPAGAPNGLGWSRSRQLVTCEAAAARVTALQPDGSVTTLASHFEGKELNSPNDLVGRSDGSIYFTDPDYGRIGYPGFPGTPRPPELPFQGVFRIPPEGALELAAEGFDSPNGLCFSKDESVLYVVETRPGRILAHDVSADGHLSDRRLFFDYPGRPDLSPGAPDGIETDVLDNVYCTGPGGIWIFDAGGSPLGIVPIPERTTNLAWGGSDRSSLYVTASTSIYRLEMSVPGNPPPYPEDWKTNAA
jgi:gluconolactonase